MNSNTVSARVQARSRADRRLQSMTLGAAALGIAATGVFGYAAALTYAGTSTADAVEQQAGLGDPGGTQPFEAGGAGSGSSGTSGNSGGSTVAPDTRNQQPVTPPTTTRHRQHAVTGGS